MNKNINPEEETNEELVEKTEVVEKQKPSIPVQKISKAPFQSANHFGKGAGGFGNMNQKQRPGRAASRGR